MEVDDTNGQEEFEEVDLGDPVSCLCSYISCLLILCFQDQPLTRRQFADYVDLRERRDREREQRADARAAKLARDLLGSSDEEGTERRKQSRRGRRSRPSKTHDNRLKVCFQISQFYLKLSSVHSLGGC